jgi:hypothetical protein
MLGWGSLASLSLFCWRFAPRRSFDAFEVTLILDIVAAIIEGLFSLTLIGSFYEFAKDAASGSTRVDRFKGRAVPGQLTKMDALRMIFGDGSVCCWVCPTDSFPEVIDLVPVRP